MTVSKFRTIHGRRFKLVAERSNRAAADGLAKSIRKKGASAVVRTIPSKSRPGKSTYVVYARSKR